MYAALFLFWGIPSVILGVILGVALNLKTEVAMPIAGTVVAIAWVLFFAIGFRKG